MPWVLYADEFSVRDYAVSKVSRPKIVCGQGFSIWMCWDFTAIQAAHLIIKDFGKAEDVKDILKLRKAIMDFEIENMTWRVEDDWKTWFHFLLATHDKLYECDNWGLVLELKVWVIGCVTPADEEILKNLLNENKVTVDDVYRIVNEAMPSSLSRTYITCKIEKVEHLDYKIVNDISLESKTAWASDSNWGIQRRLNNDGKKDVKVKQVLRDSPRH